VTLVTILGYLTQREGVTGGPMRAAPLLVALLLSSPASAATIVIDFEEEALGSHGPAFLSAECGGCVELEVLHQNSPLRIRDEAGDQILVVGDEGGSLVLTFLAPVLSVSITFGGDEPGAEAEPAMLVGMVGESFAGFDTVVANGNGAIDQALTVSGAGGTLTSALFTFVQYGETEPLSPLVGTITLEVATVPEPAAALLLAAAAAGLARVRSRSLRHRRRSERRTSS
jgi:hypothetical protein